ITTRFGEMQFRNSEDGVIFVDKYSDFKDVLKHSLEVKIERDFLTRFRQQNSWHNRFDSSYLHKFLQ
ncbi:MAG: hypothetical protein MJA83_00400, partial [Gammaproteobacteria bacterium]|nr:hypothetical protein [Gammaproteobacteria bacterium]